MKQFDDIFRENVKKAFSNYNADHLADEGWNSFTGRKQNRRRRAALIPLWARAASVAVLIGLGVFIALKISTRQIAQETVSIAESPVKTNEAPVTPYETGKEVPPAVPASAEKTAGKEKKTEKRIAEIQQINHKGDPVIEQVTLNNEPVIITEAEKSRFISPNNLTVFIPSGIFNYLNNEIKPETLISAELLSEDLNPTDKKTDIEKPFRERTLMAGLSGLIAQSSRNISPASGLSVGFYLDQKLTKKISVRPGLALAYQSFGIENINNPSVYGNLISLSDGTNGIPYSYEGKMDMLAMELPLNLVFRIIDRKRSEFYVSAGASTLFYISQQFTADLVNEYAKVSYNTASGTYSTETHYSTVEVERDYGSFSRTDFLGLANLSAGYSFPYGKTGTMLIEPFVQLPVSDLTSLNLRVRYGGVSMKLRFGKQEREK